jgi:hypothetical protein
MAAAATTWIPSSGINIRVRSDNRIMSAPAGPRDHSRGVHS